MSSKMRVSVETILILVALFIIWCDINENRLTKGVSASNKVVLDKCKCTGYCYGEIYYIGCLIDEVVHPQNCINLVLILKNAKRA